ncbi:DUF2235 domain-containing protein [Salinisphaera sp. T31B1]|uniref:DUF2235 domain-containing protein n=1 Tax=Salinisphaera sp. T31B1 TaxID=727963 RepID=UPI0033416DAE
MGKNIVICCDGTNSQFGGVETNVAHLFHRLAADSSEQRKRYEPGVGTFGANIFSVNVGRTLGKLLGAAFGYGLKQNLDNAYRYVVDCYAPGDRLFIFGFSRGAFTARSLASLVDQYGVLDRRDGDRVPEQVAAYLADAPPVRAGCRAPVGRCAPHFVGVWETVGALGLLLRLRRFKHNRLSPGVARAAQALAVDEQRRCFAPTRWDESALGSEQCVRQVWFAGVHADVGGGYVDRGLARITLDWMLEQAVAAGLRLNPESRTGPAGDPAGALHQSYRGLWRLLGRHVRRIAADADIHASVNRRRVLCRDYDPANLARARPPTG